MSGEKEQFPEIINPETGSKRFVICACAEGKERSVHAVDFLKKHGFMAKLLPGGLESFEEYLLGSTEESQKNQKMERLFARGERHIREVRVDYNSQYNRLLRIDDALWLIFISGSVESARFRKIIGKLQTSYSAEVVILESYNNDTVEEKIKGYLLGLKKD